MTEKIELGDNPFGAFVGTSAEASAEPREDVLSELMQLGDTASSTPTAPPPPKVELAAKARPVAMEPLRFDAPRSSSAPAVGEGHEQLELDRAELEQLARESLRAPGFAAEAPTAPVSEPEASPRVTSAPSEPATTTRTVETVMPSAAPETIAVREAALPGVRPPEPIDQRKLWLLRILLASNLAMMLVMLLLPHPMETRSEYVPPGPSSSAEEGVPRVVRSSGNPGPATARNQPEPFVQAPRPQSLGMPNDPQYERALLQALEGDFAGASASLRAFLAAHPGLDPALERLVHAHLAYYLRKSGEVSGAIEHETKARQMSGRAFLPEELLRTAREAELRGDGDGMRRAYAQFLLQEEQLPPALRALLQEAYLKLGDAYRVEAERAERGAATKPEPERGARR